MIANFNNLLEFIRFVIKNFLSLKKCKGILTNFTKTTNK